MKIEQQRLNEFARLYEAEFGEALSEDEARAIASRLLMLYECLMEPLGEKSNQAAALPTSDAQRS